jgi:hypothetical protein
MQLLQSLYSTAWYIPVHTDVLHASPQLHSSDTTAAALAASGHSPHASLQVAAAWVVVRPEGQGRQGTSDDKPPVL